MHRFYVENKQMEEDRIHLIGSDVNHIKNVLRMTVGEKVVICNGQGKDFYCIIVAVSIEEITLEVQDVRESETELPSKIYLFQALPKNDKMEWIIQKAVELGAFEIIPVMTKRCVVKIEDDKKGAKKRQRWQAVAESAAKQSARGIIPEVKLPLTLKQAFAYANTLEYSIIPYELAEGMDYSKKTIQEACNHASIAIFIGPEGGFEEEEIALALSQNIMPISLGKRILRTETAGMAVISILMFELST